MLYALINGSTVSNVIVWDGNTEEWEPPSGVNAVPIPSGAMVQSGYTYAGGVFSPPTATVPTLGQAQAAQLAVMAQAYQTAISQNVTFTTAGAVTKAFQADPASLANVQYMLAAYTANGAVPTGFYWLSADDTQVPFTLADLQGVAKAMGDQGWAAFQNLQNRKAAILAASTVAAVQSVVW